MVAENPPYRDAQSSGGSLLLCCGEMQLSWNHLQNVRRRKYPLSVTDLPCLRFLRNIVRLPVPISGLFSFCFGFFFSFFLLPPDRFLQPRFFSRPGTKGAVGESTAVGLKVCLLASGAASAGCSPLPREDVSTEARSRRVSPALRVSVTSAPSKSPSVT